MADPCGRTAAQVEHPEGFDIVIWPLQLASLTFFSNWNGRDYDFYFTVRPRDWNANAKSFLIKADHAGPSLRLLYRKYLILLSGVLDAAATHCLYVRIQSATNASEGIILRDLRDNTEVAIDQSRIGSYFAPHFYRDGLLFCSHDDSGAPISAAATTSA